MQNKTIKLEVADRVAVALVDGDNKAQVLKGRVASLVTKKDKEMVGVTFDKDGPVFMFDRADVLPLYRGVGGERKMFITWLQNDYATEPELMSAEMQ